MQTKPIFIGFAAAILILVIAGAAFFAGLYLGQRGYVADLQYQPQNSGLPAGDSPRTGPQAGQPAPGGVAPAGGPPGAPFWPPDGVGRFVSLTADSLTLEMPQGPVTIPIDASTKYTDEMGRELAPIDLKPGDTIAVFGKGVPVLLMRLPLNPNAP